MDTGFVLDFPPIQEVLLSNSSKRKGASFTNLERMGFRTSGILDIVTSGQLAWDGLHEKMEEPFISLGSKCIVFGNGDDDSEYVSSCGCQLAGADNADFILARGSFVVLGSGAERRYSPTIMTGEGKREMDRVICLMKERGAPMLVTNPGTNDPMPGLIGKAYADMGGTVYYVGKPYSSVYGACLQALQGNTGSSPSDIPTPIHASKIAAVGDSLPHDILGALRFGLASIFVTGGVHFQELGVGQGAGEVVADDALESTIDKHLGEEGKPTHVVPSFQW